MRRMVVCVLILCLISIDASVVLNGESAISKGHVDVVGDLESVQRNIQQPHSPMEAQNLRSALVSLRGVLEHLLTCNCCGKDRCACCRGGRRKEGWRPSNEDKHSGSGHGDKPPIHFGSTTQSLREDERAYSPVEDLDAFTPSKKPELVEEHEAEEDEHSNHEDGDERVVIEEHEAEEDERERPPLVVPPDLDEHSNREDEREGDLDENEDDREADADEAETSCSIHKDRSGCCEVKDASSPPRAGMMKTPACRAKIFKQGCLRAVG